VLLKPSKRACNINGRAPTGTATRNGNGFVPIPTIRLSATRHQTPIDESRVVLKRKELNRVRESKWHEKPALDVWVRPVPVEPQQVSNAKATPFSHKVTDRA
jgi:hypothetical protein